MSTIAAPQLLLLTQGMASLGKWGDWSRDVVGYLKKRSLEGLASSNHCDDSQSKYLGIERCRIWLHFAASFLFDVSDSDAILHGKSLRSKR